MVVLAVVEPIRIAGANIVEAVIQVESNVVHLVSEVIKIDLVETAVSVSRSKSGNSISITVLVEAALIEIVL